jgi:hypothetical protein
MSVSRISRNNLSPSWESVFSAWRSTRNAKRTFGLDRSSSRPASLRIAETSHVYALLSQPHVATRLPSVEKNAHDTSFACWRGEPMGYPFSKFHSSAVPSNDAPARIRPFRNIAMPRTTAAIKAAIIVQSYDPNLLSDPSKQACYTAKF